MPTGETIVLCIFQDKCIKIYVNTGSKNGRTHVFLLIDVIYFTAVL